jgi:hypothetical protein
MFTVSNVEELQCVHDFIFFGGLTVELSRRVSGRLQ